MTIFTKIINGEIPCYKVAENEHFFAFLDIAPMTKGHTLVIPKFEADNEGDYIFDMDDEMYAGLMMFAKQAAKYFDNAEYKINIDHHQDNKYEADFTLSIPGISSTCEIIFEIIKKTLDKINEMEKNNVTPQVTAYYFDTDVMECFKRVKIRNTKEGELYLPEEVVFSYNEKIIKLPLSINQITSVRIFS